MADMDKTFTQEEVDKMIKEREKNLILKRKS